MYDVVMHQMPTVDLAKRRHRFAVWAALETAAGRDPGLALLASDHKGARTSCTPTIGVL